MLIKFFFPPPPRVTIPPEFASEAALLAYLGLSEKELKKIWWFREKMYRSFTLPKGNGKFRTIEAPDNRLKYLQYKIAPLLDQLYRVRNPVHGFVSNKSIKTNALAHVRKRFILNIDLKSFFPSITEKRIVGVLKSLGINNRVAEIIARICCYWGHLPQGAPTSPVLSNMICFRLDKDLLSFAKMVRCIYTRYVDDITFSSYQPMTALFQDVTPAAGHFSPDLLSKKLQDVVRNNGFEINPNKVHYADRNSRKTVTGLKVNEFLNVDRRFVRNIRAALQSVEKLGIEEAQKKFQGNYGGSSDLRDHLLGKMTWLRHIRGQADPVVRGLAVRFNSNFPERAIEILPSNIEIRDRAVWIIEYYREDTQDIVQGSAFFLKDVGLVTAAHCVTNNAPMHIYHPSKLSNKFEVQVNQVDNKRDLAILGHNIPLNEYFELERSIRTIAVSDELTAVGYPDFGLTDKVNIRLGTVSSFTSRFGVQYIEVTQKLLQGMSGGPLLDNNFGVAGVIHKGGANEARDFAIHLDELNTWLALPVNAGEIQA